MNVLANEKTLSCFGLGVKHRAWQGIQVIVLVLVSLGTKRYYS